MGKKVTGLHKLKGQDSGKEGRKEYGCREYEVGVIMLEQWSWQLARVAGNPRGKSIQGEPHQDVITLGVHCESHL